MPRSGHDRAAIGPRSGHDRGPGHASHAVRSSGNDSTLKEVPIVARSSSDRTAIGSRSSYDRSSSSCFVCHPMKIAAKNLERPSRDALSAI